MSRSGIFLAGIFTVVILIGTVSGNSKLFKDILYALTGLKEMSFSSDDGTDPDQIGESFILSADTGAAKQQYLGLGTVGKIKLIEGKIEDTFKPSDTVRNYMISLNGGFQRIICRTFVEDSDKGADVIKIDGKYLARLQTDDISGYVSKANDLTELNSFLSSRGIPLVFTHVPYKIEYADIPIENRARDNYRYLNDTLIENGVTVIDMKNELDKTGGDFFEMYYRTDHHWKAETGLWCADMLAGYFRDNYGFEYNEKVLSPDSFNFQTLDDYFLGSHGRRVGPLYAGTDDFTFITPSFETSLETDTLYSDGVWQNRTGSFEQVMLWKENIDSIDYFNKSPYATYLNGDYPIMIFKNNMADNDRKILIVKHSYANVTMPYLALLYKEITAVDLRRRGRPENLYEFIEENEPDLVLFMW